jgi:enamine deaminase RidA (YjgF/YER057c/UK114 family)
MIMTQRQAVFPAGRQALYEKYKYSAAIRSGDLLFVSGQVGSREDGTPEPDFERQVELAFENLKAVLKAAGCTIGDVVDVTTFHTDPESQLDTMLKVRDSISVTPPIRTSRPSASIGLPGLISRSRSLHAFQPVADLTAPLMIPNLASVDVVFGKRESGGGNTW